jgi:histone deacetylase 1/2
VAGAVRLNHGLADVAVNWAGGLHHAKKAEASGFCYVNDLVLAILELLKYHARVLYIDIDIHHGDGVEEAFYLTDRVMTLSLHRYGDFFFPGTGDLGDVGERRGRGYSVNVPLREGTDDATFLAAFKPVMAKIMEVFRPGAIVLQCGADSLAGDRLGCFSLTLEGHAEAVRTVARYGVPTLVTGGGGYTKANVARAWCAETAALAGVRLHSGTPIPDGNAYAEYYAPTHALGVTHPRGLCDNANAPADVDRIVRAVLARLSRLEGAPGVALAEMPPDACVPEYPGGGDGDGSEGEGDERLGEYGLKHLVVRGGDDEEGFF